MAKVHAGKRFVGNESRGGTLRVSTPASDFNEETNGPYAVQGE